MNSTQIRHKMVSHVPGTILGPKRARIRQTPRFALVQFHTIKDVSVARNYVGKKLELDLPAKNGVKTIRGKVIASHGNSGVLRCRFTVNLPPLSFGKPCRMLL